jgi:hypothetical protein
VNFSTKDGVAPRKCSDFVAVDCVNPDAEFHEATETQAAKCEVASTPSNCEAGESGSKCMTIEGNEWVIFCNNGVELTDYNENCTELEQTCGLDEYNQYACLSASTNKCGNDNLDEGEDCDGEYLSKDYLPISCESYMHVYGMEGEINACTSECRYDTSACKCPLGTDINEDGDQCVEIGGGATCKDAVSNSDVEVDGYGCSSANTYAVCTESGWDTVAPDTCLLGCGGAEGCNKCTAAGYVCDGAKAILCAAADSTPAADDVETCSDADHCTAANGCVECLNDDECEGDATCGSDGKCVASSANCTANEIRCSGSKLQQCKADGSAWDDLFNCGVDSEVADKPVCYADRTTCVECLEDSDGREAAKPVCNTASHQCEASDVEPEWIDIVNAPTAYVSSDIDSRFSFVETATDTFTTKKVEDAGYINSIPWASATADFTGKYVKIIFSDEELSSLAEKRTIGISTKLASNGSDVDKALIAFFNGDTMIGSACEATVTKSGTELDKEDCNVAYTSTENLHVRIIGLKNGTGTKTGLRIYPVTISAK